MQKALIALCKVVPLPLIYAIVALVIPFYMLFDRRGYKASYNFFRRLGYNPLRSFFHVYLNEFNLGMVVVDRFAMYAGKTFKVDYSSDTAVKKRLGEPGGLIMLSSHFGNYELGGYTFKAPKRMNALVYSGETKAVMEGREQLFKDNNIRMVEVSEDMSHLFTLVEALGAGEIVSMPADRVYGSGKYFLIPFLGHDARFPAGPYVFAEKMKVPAIGVVILKRGIRRYKVWTKELTPGTAEEMAREAVASAEPLIRKYPDHWFNFFNIWQ